MDILKDFMDFVRRSYSRQRRQLSGGGAAQIPPRVASCSSSCPGVSSPGIPLTTTFSPPTSCFNYWTPVATYNSESPTIRFTQNATRDECVPSRWARCKDCGMTISPGICPSGWPAAYTAILNDVTTHYCCPLYVPLISIQVELMQY